MTDELWNEESPAWDMDGEFLYYLSDREFTPQISTLEWNYAGNRMTSIYALTLKKDGKNPFPPLSDEVTTDEKKKKPRRPTSTASRPDKPADKKPEGEAAARTDEKKAEPEKKTGPFRVDFDGLADRVTRVPVEAENYQGLGRREGRARLREGRRAVLRPRLVRRSRSRLLLVQGPQGVDDRRRRVRRRGLGRRGEGARPAEGPPTTSST